MTTADVPVATPVASVPRDELAGTGTLLRFMLRRDRVRLPAWLAGIGLFAVYVTTAIPAAYPTEDDLEDVLGLLDTPIGRMLVGPGYGFDEPTYETVIANGYGLYFMIIAALMSILLVVRHTRADEQTGRAELVRASVVGRYAALTACLIVAVIANVAAALIVLAVMVGVGGFGATGSLVLGVSVGASGLVFASIATVTAQLTSYSRAASSMASAVLGAAFVVRGGGDMAQAGGSALSWCSPLGWAQQTAPFVLDRWWPLLLLLGLTVAASAAGYALVSRRDLGASFVAVRPGRARALPRLGTPFGLAARLHRASIIGWTSAVTVTGFVNGLFSDALLEESDDLPGVFTDLFGEGDLVAGYFAYIAAFDSYLLAAFAILVVQGVRSDETRGRMESVLAAPVGRARWLGANLAVAAIGVLAMSLVVGVVSGFGAMAVTGDGSYVGDLAAAQVNLVPALWVVLALAVLAFGVLPRAIGVAWALLGFGVFVGTFGPVLDLPQAVLDLSPFEHPAEIPADDVAIVPLVILTAVAAALVAAGLVGFGRRDIDTN